MRIRCGGANWCLGNHIVEPWRNQCFGEPTFGLFHWLGAQKCSTNKSSKERRKRPIPWSSVISREPTASWVDHVFPQRRGLTMSQDSLGLVLLYPMILSVFVFHMYIAINDKLLLNPPFSTAGQTYPISSPAYHWYNAYMPKQWPEIAQTWPGKSKYLFKHQKNYYTCISLYIHIFDVYIYRYYTVY